MRVSRTNGSGRFTIKGVAPGTYRCFALQDADGDFLFGQKSEMIAFNHDSIVPSWRPDIRQDTIWRDSLHIANILQVNYTHFLPDDITLLCFQEPQTDRYLLKTERKDPNRLGIFFTYGSDSLPRLRGLNFDSENAFILEASQKNDTLTYWLADTTLVNQDTLTIEKTFLMTDSLGNLVEFTDTTEFVSKVPYAKRLKERQKEYDEWKKEQDRKKKRKEPYDSIMPPKYMNIKWSVTGQMDPGQRIYFDAPEPLRRCDTTAVHLFSVVDSVETPVPLSLYGLVSNSIKQGLKVKTTDDYSMLSVSISGIADSVDVIMELLDQSDKVVRREKVGDNRQADFFYLKPGTYYIRAFEDWNRNGRWDTGCYDDDLQAEPVYYHHEEIECKQKWDVSRSWNVAAMPRYKQKPGKITKQKPDKAKQLKNRNLERAKEKGIQYLKDQGVRL